MAPLSVDIQIRASEARTPSPLEFDSTDVVNGNHMEHPLRFLAVGDLHIRESNPDLAVQIQTKLLKIIRKLRKAGTTLDYVVFLGDTLHDHSVLHTQALNPAIKLIEAVAKKVQVYLLIGNHDYINNGQFLTDEHPFNSLKTSTLPISVVDRAVRVDINGWDLVFCPYVPPGRLIEAISTLIPEPDRNGTSIGELFQSVDVVHTHPEINGAKLGAIEVTNGDTWPESFPLNVAGHIHDAQIIGDNVVYIGTPAQHSFNESVKKAVGYFELAVKHPTISNSTYERISLELPRKRILRYQIGDDGDPDLRAIAEKILRHPKRKDMFKVVFRGTGVQITSLKKQVDYKPLTKLGNVHLSFDKIAIKKRDDHLPKSLREERTELPDSARARPRGDSPNRRPPPPVRSFYDILKAFVDESDNPYIKEAYDELLPSAD